MNIVVQRSTVRITNRKLIQSIRSDPSTFWTANMRGPKFVRALCQQPADDVAPRPERDGRRTVMRWQIVTRRAPRTMAGAGLGRACRAAPSSARQKRQPTPPRRSHGPVSVVAAENGGTAWRTRRRASLPRRGSATPEDPAASLPRAGGIGRRRGAGPTRAYPGQPRSRSVKELSILSFLEWREGASLAALGRGSGHNFHKFVSWLCCGMAIDFKN